MTMRVVIVGAGPSGALLARALRVRGIGVVIVDRSPAPWFATYGAWCDEVEADLGAMKIGPPWRCTWSSTRVVAGTEYRFQRRYGVFDNELLRESCLDGVDVIEAIVTELHQGDGDALVRCADGREIRGDLVVDARGTPGNVGGDDNTAVQTAYGLVVPAEELVRRGIEPDEMTLMDWTAVADDGPPTFLYAMHTARDEGLVEETSLCSVPAYEHAELRHRLNTRMGADLVSVAHDVEVVHIAMPDATPKRRVAVFAFGASGGLVHPVTGYSVGAAVRLSHRVADALVGAAARGKRGSGLRDCAWDALWTPAMRRTRALHRLGARVARRLDTRETVEFFGAFFALPVHVWGPYLRIDAPPANVRRAMLAVFRRGSWRLKLRLASFPGALVRALVAR